MTRAAQVRRQLTRTTLQHGIFDVLVVGGGIIGLSTAWHAARSGLRVALVEAGDFAGATSSASTKLVHGGLRYLAMGDLRLVYENHTERRALGDELAPHLVRPLPFLVPLYEGGPYGRVRVGAGMLVYSALSKFDDGPGKLLSARRAAQMVPALRLDGLRGCGLYYDHQMNDARVALMVAHAASECGAVLANYSAVTGFLVENGRMSGACVVDRLDGTEYAVAARAVVNATGPWVDHVRRLEDPDAAPSVQLSKGAHLVVRLHAPADGEAPPWRAALTVPLADGRVSFAIPWEDQLLLGTTDEPYDGDPAAVQCTDADEARILSEAGQAIDPAWLAAVDVRYRFAGLRVLPRSEQDTQHIRRETVISRGRYGLISVAGGKWTTFRRIGLDVLRQIAETLGGTAIDDHRMMLPGAAHPDAVARILRAAHPELPADVVAHLAGHYGTYAHEISRILTADPRLAERIHPDGPDIWAQVAYAVADEWACTVDDILRRRTTVEVRGLATPEVHAEVERWLQRTGVNPMSRWLARWTRPWPSGRKAVRSAVRRVS